MIKKLIALLQIIWLLIGCSDATVERATIVTQTNQAGADSIWIRYDSKDEDNFYYSGKITGDHFFLQDSQVIKFAATDPVFFIEAASKQTPFVLYPGDSVTIRGAPDSIQLLSAKPDRQPELDFFKALVEAEGPIINLVSTSYAKQATTLRDRDGFIQKKYAARLAFLDSYKKKFTIRDAFDNYCREVFSYAKLNEQLSMYYQGFNKAEIFNYYRDSIPAFRSLLSNDRMLHHSIFRYALLNLGRYYAPAGNTKAWLFLDGLAPASLLTIWDSVTNNFRGEVKAFLQTQVWKSLSFQKYPLVKLQQLADAITNDDYHTYVQSLLEDQQVLNLPTSLFDQKLYTLQGDSILFKTVLPKDTLVVIDFWASWCVPCIREFKYAGLLEKQMANKPIKFISLSTDERRQSWQEAAARYNVNTNSYFITGFNNSKMSADWKVTSIPRYIIMKNDTVVNADVPYPSDGDKLLRILNSFLKKSH